MTKLKLKLSLTSFRPRNPLSMLARRRAAGRHRAASAVRRPVARDEVDEWLHRIRSAGM